MTDTLTARMGAYFGDKIAEVDSKIANVTNFRTVQDVVARDLIPMPERFDGMWVKVLSPTEAMYFLQGGTGNECWIDFLALNADGLPTPGLHSHPMQDVIGLGSAASREAEDFAPASLTIQVSQLDARMPSRLSQLTNDTGFATSLELETRLNALVDGAPAAMDTFREVAVELAADKSGLAALTNVVAGKANADLSNVGMLPEAVRAQLKGDPGPAGPQGAQGPVGSAGLAGSNGSKWHSANTAPSEAATAVTGDFILLTNGDIYSKTAAGYNKTGNIKGTTGPTGPAGPAGTAGPQGPQGPGGSRGPQGPSGGDAYSDSRFSPLLFNNKWDSSGNTVGTWGIPAGVGRFFVLMIGGGGGGGAAGPRPELDGWSNNRAGGSCGEVRTCLITREDHPELFEQSRTLYYACGLGGMGQTVVQEQNAQNPAQNGTYATTSPYYWVNAYDGNGGETYIGYYDHRGTTSLDYFTRIETAPGGGFSCMNWWGDGYWRYNDFAKLQALYGPALVYSLSAAQSAAAGEDGFARKIYNGVYTATGGAKIVYLNESIGGTSIFGVGGTPTYNGAGGSAAAFTGAGGAGGCAADTNWRAGGQGGSGRVIIFY